MVLSCVPSAWTEAFTERVWIGSLWVHSYRVTSRCDLAWPRTNMSSFSLQEVAIAFTVLESPVCTASTGFSVELVWMYRLVNAKFVRSWVCKDILILREKGISGFVWTSGINVSEIHNCLRCFKVTSRVDMPLCAMALYFAHHFVRSMFVKSEESIMEIDACAIL